MKADKKQIRKLTLRSQIATMSLVDIYLTQVHLTVGKFTVVVEDLPQMLLEAAYSTRASVQQVLGF